MTGARALSNAVQFVVNHDQTVLDVGDDYIVVRDVYTQLNFPAPGWEWCEKPLKLKSFAEIRGWLGY